jgi:hypothetical protein
VFSVPSLLDIINGTDEETTLTKTPIYDLMKTQRATLATLNIISSKLNILSYDVFEEQLNTTLGIAKMVEGHWISYRFEESRRVYISYWSFTYNAILNVFNVDKVSKTENYTGEFTLSHTNLFTGVLRNGDALLHYASYITTGEALDVVTFNLTYKNNNEAYFTREVMYTYDGEIPNKGRLAKGEITLFEPSHAAAYKINQIAEAYNYLTKISNHSRLHLDQDKWKYQHSIFISFPVRSLYGLGEEKFKKKQGIVQDIINKLSQPPFLFDSKHIYNEFTSSDYQEIKDETRVFKNVKEHIDSTHFIAILPKGLSDKNTGCYFEIYYRINKKLPCLVYYHKSVKFPHALKGFLDNNYQNNVRFKAIDLVDIPEYLNADIFNLNIH